MADNEDSGGFLSRWSRRKAQGAQGDAVAPDGAVYVLLNNGDLFLVDGRALQCG